MLASNRCSGLVRSWCGTHAMIHSCSNASGASLRDHTPGAAASGQVCAAASAAKSASAATGQPARRAASGRRDIAVLRSGSPVQREIRARPLDPFEPGIGHEERVLKVVDARGAPRKRGELPGDLVVLFEEL